MVLIKRKFEELHLLLGKEDQKRTTFEQRMAHPFVELTGGWNCGDKGDFDYVSFYFQNMRYRVRIIDQGVLRYRFPIKGNKFLRWLVVDHSQGALRRFDGQFKDIGVENKEARSFRLT